MNNAKYKISKAELLEIAIRSISLGGVGFILFFVGFSDLIHIINLKFFNPDRYTELSNKYAEITSESVYNTQYIMGLVFMTILGLFLIGYFIYTLKFLISYKAYKKNKI